MSHRFDRTGRLATPGSISFALIALLFLASPALADGVVYSKRGRLVQEEEQHAFIEWENGQERLYVATHFTAKSEPTLWLLPIMSDPKSVVAEPIDVFPRVVFEDSAFGDARSVLKQTIAVTAVLDTAPFSLLLLPMFSPKGCSLGVDSNTAFLSVNEAPDVEVHRHVEEFGMVVEVLTAKSTSGLEKYLRAKEIDLRAVDLTSLKSYLETDCALVCGWSASTSEAPQARALRIDFPTPRVFYPLLPTSAYELPLESSIYVRGPFQLVKGSGIAARCQLVHASVREQSATEKRKVPHFPPDMLLTRVVLPRTPKLWTDDLWLEPADSVALKAANSIAKLGYGFTLLMQTTVGAALGLCLPLALIKPKDRRLGDFFGAAWVGATLCLSLIVSAFIFREWLQSTPERQASKAANFRIEQSACLVAAFTPLIFFAALIVFTLLLGVAGMIVAAIVAIVFFLRILSTPPPTRTQTAEATNAVWRNSPWPVFVGFALAHFAMIASICLALHVWLAQY